MNTQTIVIALVVIVLIGGGLYLFTTAGTPNTDSGSGAEPEASETSTGLRAEDNAVVATDQRPGNSVTIAQVYLAAPGYVVIHEESGAIIGASALLPAGQSDAVPVALTRASREGETLSAMLHAEGSGNATFQAESDLPVESRLGGAIMGEFMVSSSAEVNVPISI